MLLILRSLPTSEIPKDLEIPEIPYHVTRIFSNADSSTVSCAQLRYTWIYCSANIAGSKFEIHVIICERTGCQV